MGKKLFIAVVAALLSLSSPVRAQDNAAQFANELALLNQTPAARNPRFFTSLHMLSMKVLSPNRQLIGQVADVQVDESGAVVKLVSRLNNLGREQNLVQSAAHEITFHEPINAFEIPLAPGQAQQTAPEDLAAIAPAAGGGEILSLKAMTGAEVRSTDGRRLGIVKDVLFDDQAQAVQALVIENVPGARRYADIAIPFNTGDIDTQSDYGRIEFRVDPFAAQELLEFAKGRR